MSVYQDYIRLCKEGDLTGLYEYEEQFRSEIDPATLLLHLQDCELPIFQAYTLELLPRLDIDIDKQKLIHGAFLSASNPIEWQKAKELLNPFINRFQFTGKGWFDPMKSNKSVKKSTDEQKKKEKNINQLSLW